MGVELSDQAWSKVDAWSAAIDAANAWRGKCVHLIATAETAVTETLLELKEIPDRGATVKLPHLIGQRFDALATLINADGLFAKEGKRVSQSLADFRAHKPLRDFLCHGTGKVFLDQQGQWLLSLRLLTLRSGKVARDERFITEEEAGDVIQTLQRAAQSLSSKLAGLRKAVSAQPNDSV